MSKKDVTFSDPDRQALNSDPHRIRIRQSATLYNIREINTEHKAALVRGKPGI
jgi:hypothetical protein